MATFNKRRRHPVAVRAVVAAPTAGHRPTAFGGIGVGHETTRDGSIKAIARLCLGACVLLTTLDISARRLPPAERFMGPRGTAPRHANAAASNATASVGHEAVPCRSTIGTEA
jgi:hypothetical protein